MRLVSLGLLLAITITRTALCQRVPEPIRTVAPVGARALPVDWMPVRAVPGDQVNTTLGLFVGAFAVGIPLFILANAADDCDDPYNCPDRRPVRLAASLSVGAVIGAVVAQRFPRRRTAANRPLEYSQGTRLGLSPNMAWERLPTVVEELGFTIARRVPAARRVVTEWREVPRELAVEWLDCGEVFVPSVRTGAGSSVSAETVMEVVWIRLDAAIIDDRAQSVLVSALEGRGTYRTSSGQERSVRCQSNGAIDGEIVPRLLASR